MSEISGKLLVVDDNEMNRDMLGRRLSRRGHSVLTAENGQQALDLIGQEAFDVVLLDIMMPGISGIDVLRRVREEYSASDLPIIMATAKSESEDIVDALKLGANDYVTKPLNFPVVLARVETQLSLKKAQDALRSAHDRMKHDLDAAARVQQSLLPWNLPETDSVDIAWKYLPCDELAGDFLNIFRINEETIGVYIVDVCGHGVPAALFSFTISRSLLPFSGTSSIVLESASRSRPTSPLEILKRLNSLFPVETNDFRFFTLLYGVLDTSSGVFRFANAGHPGPIRISADGQTKEFEVPTNPIGLMENPEFGEATVELSPGDRLYLYSDGLVEEANSAREPFELERLRDSMKKNLARPLDESVANIVDAVVDWHGRPNLSDDVSIIGIERKKDA